MLVINLYGVIATWRQETQEWESKEGGVLLTRRLNWSIPDEAQTAYAHLLDGGREGVVLKGAREVYPDLEVVAMEVPIPPPERDGILI